MALCLGLPSWAGTRKVKPIWILLKQETVSGSGISWAACKSAPCSGQITTPALYHSFFSDALPITAKSIKSSWYCTRKLCWIATFHSAFPTSKVLFDYCPMPVCSNHQYCNPDFFPFNPKLLLSCALVSNMSSAIMHQHHQLSKTTEDHPHAWY